jgi:ATP-dependent DNA ligase
LRGDGCATAWRNDERRWINRKLTALLGPALRAGCDKACLYAFDLLHVGDEDLRGLALVERRALLREHLKHAAGSAILYSEHMDGADGEAMFRHACAMGLEGIVSKRVDSRYKSGRCLSWVEVKNPAYERAPARVPPWDRPLR